MPSYKSKTGYACSCPNGNCDMSCRMYRLVSNKTSNADMIRAMSDEELATWLCDVAGWLPAFEGRAHPILEWLRQEAK